MLPRVSLTNFESGFFNGPHLDLYLLPPIQMHATNVLYKLF